MLQENLKHVLVTSRLNKKQLDVIRNEGGFTLIELLIVLTLVIVIIGIALPNIQAMYRGFEDSITLEDIEKQLRHLSFKAYLKGQNLTLSDETATTLLEVPEGYKLTSDNPITYRYDGICKGGMVTLSNEDKNFRYQLDPPYCFPYLIETNE